MIYENDNVMVHLDSQLKRANVRPYKQQDSLKSEIVTLQRRIARAIKSSSPSEQRRAERLAEILKSRMEALSAIVEADIARLSKPKLSDAEIDAISQKDEEQRAGITSIPLPEFVPPVVG
jgi:hypothetical protein